MDLFNNSIGIVPPICRFSFFIPSVLPSVSIGFGRAAERIKACGATRMCVNSHGRNQSFFDIEELQELQKLQELQTIVLLAPF